MNLSAGLRVGEWHVDPGSNELRRKGTVVRIEPKAMEVLLALAEQPGEVVSREKLLDAVWPGMMVGDDALTQAVIKLRKALGDESRSPAYIETIPKRGYRLLAPVEFFQKQPAARLQPDTAKSLTQHPGRLPARSRRIFLTWAGVVVVLAGLAGVIALIVEHNPPGPLQPGMSGADAIASFPTIAIQAFESLPEGGQDYLAEGIAADLATDLSSLAGLRVIRMPLSGQASTPASRYVVSGSVQRGNGQIKINAWLMESATRQQLWSARYDRPYRDLMIIQDEIVNKLVELLPIKISEAEQQRLAYRHTRSIEAYDAFLRGQIALMARDQGENHRAQAWYRQAISLDPAFARAYAGLAMSYANEHRYQWGSDNEDSLARALEFANTARQINPDLREINWVLAWVHSRRHEHQQALDALKRAIAIDPSYADAYGFMAAVYCYMGQPEKALPLLRSAMRLNPDAGYLFYLALGYAYFFLDELEQAMINLKEAEKRNPADLETRVYLAAAYAAAGNRAAAEWEVQEIRTLQPDFALRDWLSDSPMTDAAQKRKLMDLLGHYGL